MKEIYKKEYKSSRILQYFLHPLGRKAVVINAEKRMHMETAELDTDSSKTISACTFLEKSAGTSKGVLTSV